jgi:hypothetical protein
MLTNKGIRTLANKEFPNFFRPVDTTDSIVLGAAAAMRRTEAPFGDNFISARKFEPAATTHGSLSADISAMLRIISRVHATSSSGPKVGVTSLPLLTTRLRQERTFEMVLELPEYTLTFLICGFT